MSVSLIPRWRITEKCSLPWSWHWLCDGLVSCCYRISRKHTLSSHWDPTAEPCKMSHFQNWNQDNVLPPLITVWELVSDVEECSKKKWWAFLYRSYTVRMMIKTSLLFIKKPWIKYGREEPSKSVLWKAPACCCRTFKRGVKFGTFSMWFQSTQVSIYSASKTAWIGCYGCFRQNVWILFQRCS